MKTSMARWSCKVKLYVCGLFPAKKPGVDTSKEGELENDDIYLREKKALEAKGKTFVLVGGSEGTGYFSNVGNWYREVLSSVFLDQEQGDDVEDIRYVYNLMGEGHMASCMEPIPENNTFECDLNQVEELPVEEVCGPLPCGKLFNVFWKMPKCTICAVFERDAKCVDQQHNTKNHIPVVTRESVNNFKAIFKSPSAMKGIELESYMYRIDHVYTAGEDAVGQTKNTPFILIDREPFDLFSKDDFFFPEDCLVEGFLIWTSIYLFPNESIFGASLVFEIKPEWEQKTGYKHAYEIWARGKKVSDVFFNVTKNEKQG